MIKRFLSARLWALLLTLFALGPWLSVAQAQDATEALQAARAPGTHLLMRHALALALATPLTSALPTVAPSAI